MTVFFPSHQLTWKCTNPFSRGKYVVFPQGSVHFHVSRWEGNFPLFCDQVDVCHCRVVFFFASNGGARKPDLVALLLLIRPMQ